ncbi:MAG: hypothetical protein ACRYGR_10510 [Janthinobacterium lividum]
MVIRWACATLVFVSMLPQPARAETVSQEALVGAGAEMFAAHDLSTAFAGGKPVLGWHEIYPNLLHIEAPAYWRLWQQNVIAAEQRTRGVPIVISGHVLNVNEDPNGFYVDFVSSPSEIDDVRAYIEADTKTFAATLRPGQHIELMCKASPELLSHTNLSGCQTPNQFITHAAFLVRMDVIDWLNGETPKGFLINPDVRKLLLIVGWGICHGYLSPDLTSVPKQQISAVIHDPELLTFLKRHNH